MTTAQKVELAALNFGLPPIMTKSTSQPYSFDGELQIALKGKNRKYSRYQMVLTPFFKKNPGKDFKRVAIGHNEDTGEIYFAFDVPGYEVASMAIDSQHVLTTVTKCEQLFELMGLRVPTMDDEAMSITFSLHSVETVEGHGTVYKMIPNSAQLARLKEKEYKSYPVDIENPTIEDVAPSLERNRIYVYKYSGEEKGDMIKLLTTPALATLDDEANEEDLYLNAITITMALLSKKIATFTVVMRGTTFFTVDMRGTTFNYNKFVVDYTILSAFESAAYDESVDFVLFHIL